LNVRGLRERSLKDALAVARVKPDAIAEDADNSDDEDVRMNDPVNNEGTYNALVALARSEFLEFYTKVGGL
jgi:hypothetical protein